MDFKQSVTTCLRKYADFNGRGSRSEFWWFMLACVVAQLLVQTILGPWIAMLFNLALLVPSLSAGARRLHDMGKSGWLQLLWLVPLIGWAILIYWLVQPTVGANEYGEGPALPEATVLPPGAV